MLVRKMIVLFMRADIPIGFCTHRVFPGMVIFLGNRAKAFLDYFKLYPTYKKRHE